MQSHIPESTIEIYQRDGIVALPGVFTDWVAPLTEALLGVIERQRHGETQPVTAGYEFHNDLNVIENFGGGVMALNVFRHDPGFHRWLKTSAAAEMAARIMGSEQARFWIDASFYKDAANADSGTPWHNDTCTWPFWGRQMAILWIALTDIGPDDGPLTTVRGSQLGDGRYYSPFFPPTQAPPPPYKPWDELLAQTEGPDAEIQTWTLRAGDCLFMHPSTIHGSLPRRGSSQTPRLSFSTRWLGDDVVWRPDPLTEVMTARLNDNPVMRPGEAPPESIIPIQWRTPGPRTHGVAGSRG